MASTRSTSPASSGDATPETTDQERTLIREVFATEFGGTCINAVDVRSPELFNALTTRRLDNDHDDNGSLHSRILKNSIDLLQRVQLAAPVFPVIRAEGASAAAVPENLGNNIHLLFWRATFLRYFCDDIEGMDCSKVWLDVRRFVMALKLIWEKHPGGGCPVPARTMLMAVSMMGGARRPARQRSRENALLWELMGMTSAALKEEARHREMETWSVEVTARAGLWRKLFKDRNRSTLCAPISEDTGAYPKDVLPEYSEGELLLSYAVIRCSG